MAKGTAVKITKLFGQQTIQIGALATFIQGITDSGATIMSILQTSTPDVYLVVFVSSKKEEVEVEIPDELESLPQADGTSN